MKKVFAWFNEYNHRWWRRGVALLLTFVILCVLSNTVFNDHHDKQKPKAPAVTVPTTLISASLATGVDAGCRPVFLPPGTECKIGLQPGNTRALSNYVNWEIARGVSAAAILSAIAALMCDLFIPFGWIYIGCVILVGGIGLNDFAHLFDASNAERCWAAKIRFTGVFPTGRSTYGYGGTHWRSPIWFAPWNMFIAQWNRNDSCAVNVRDAGSRYFFGHRCWDYLSPGIPLWAKFDGFSSWNCQSWLNVV